MALTPEQLLKKLLAAFGGHPSNPTSRTNLYPFLKELCEVSGGAGTGPVFVYRPGEPNPAGNVYADWQLLYAAVSAAKGLRFIEIDVELVNPAPIPVGVYDLQGCIIEGLVSQISPGLDLASGARLRGVRTYRNLFMVTNRANAAAPPAIELVNSGLGGGGPAILFLETAIVTSSTPFPGIVVDGGSVPFAVIALINGARLGDGTNPVLRAQNAATAQTVAFNQAAIFDNFAESDALSQLVVGYADDAAEIPSAQPPGVLGPYLQTCLQFQPVSALYCDVAVGSDQIGDGTTRRPFQNIQRAIDAAVAKGLQRVTVRLFPGQYDGVIIPTGTSLQYVTIESIGGGVNGGGARIFPTTVANGIEITAGNAADADAFLGLTVRDVAVASPQVGIFLADFSVGGQFFLQDGLNLDRCDIQGDFEAISMVKVYDQNHAGCTVGQVTMDQCQSGIWSDCHSTSTLTINTDNDSPMPSPPLDPAQVFLGCTFDTVDLSFQPKVRFDKSCRVRQFSGLSLSESAGGRSPQIQYKGTSEHVFLDPALAAGVAIEAAIYDIDDATIQDLDCTDPGNATPPTISARNGIVAAEGGHQANISGNLNLDLRGSRYTELNVIALGAATVDTDTRSVPASGGAGAPVPLVFSLQWPAAATYVVIAESDVVGGVAITGKTSIGFNQTAPLGATVNCLAVRSP